MDRTLWLGRAKAEADRWLISVHSSGGQGTFYAVTHFPDAIISAAAFRILISSEIRSLSQRDRSGHTDHAQRSK